MDSVSDSTKDIEPKTETTCAECSCLLLLCTIRRASDIAVKLRGCPDYNNCRRVFRRKYRKHLDDSEAINTELSVHAQNFTFRECNPRDLELLTNVCVNDDWAVFSNAARNLQLLVRQFLWSAPITVYWSISWAIKGIKFKHKLNRGRAQELFLHWIRQSDLLVKGELMLQMDFLNPLIRRIKPGINPIET